MYGTLSTVLLSEINGNFHDHRRAMRILTILVLTLTYTLGAQGLSQVKVHSHNDYQQAHPFEEAYKSGAHSIEVDIFLKRDTLFVTHDEADIKEGTPDLETLYLRPIQSEFEKGTLREVQLLIDIKSASRPTLRRLIQILQHYKALIESGKVKWVISGNRPPPLSYVTYPDYLFFDYQSLNDLKDPKIWDKVALISLPFYRYSTWDGESELPVMERQKISSSIQKAHEFKKPFRFWATPDTEIAWETFAQMGLDFINTDRPSTCMETLYQK